MMCDPKNVTFFFLNNKYFLQWDIKFYRPECKFIISVANGCVPDDIFCRIGVEVIGERHVNKSLECLNPLSNFPLGLTINVAFDNNSCIEVDNSCRSRTIYVPVVSQPDVVKVSKNGIILPDLSSRYCNLIEDLHSIKLCVDSKLFYGCFNAFKSPYFNLTLTSNNTVGLEVQSLSANLNKTDISLFCASTECTMNNPLHTLIKSVRLEVTEEECQNCSPHATCIIRKCECNTDYTGNGQQCEKLCENCILNATCEDKRCICVRWQGLFDNGRDCECNQPICEEQSCMTCNDVSEICRMCESMGKMLLFSPDSFLFAFMAYSFLV
jgi:hypothetical protein